MLASRASYFDLAGRFLGLASSRASPSSGDEGFLRPVAPLRDGTFLGLTPPMSTAIARGELTETPYVRMDSEGRSLDLIWTQRWERRDVFGGSSLSQPFGDADLSGFGKRGLLVVERRAWTGEGDASERFDPVASDTGENLHEWWVLNGEANPVARALTPVDLELKLITDDAVWGIERDDLDVEYIVRNRLIRND